MKKNRHRSFASSWSTPWPLCLCGVLLFSSGAIPSALAAQEQSVVEQLAPVLAAEDAREFQADLFGRALVAPDSLVRRIGALAAGRIGDHRATPIVVRLLSDPDSTVRVAAAFALGLLRDSAAVEPLIDRLTGHAGARCPDGRRGRHRPGQDRRPAERGFLRRCPGGTGGAVTGGPEHGLQSGPQRSLAARRRRPGDGIAPVHGGHQSRASAPGDLLARASAGGGGRQPDAARAARSRGVHPLARGPGPHPFLRRFGASGALSRGGSSAPRSRGSESGGPDQRHSLARQL